MFLDLLDPDPDLLVRGMDPDLDPDPCIIKQNSKKNLDSYCFVTSLSLKDDVYVSSKSKNQKNLEKQ
jgi:hypothetical protein